MPSPAAELYAALGRAFGTLGLRWYLFGAQAAIRYGVVRFTEDVDVTVELGALSTRLLVDALTKEGFRPRVVDDLFIQRTRVVPVVHDATTTPVDVVIAGPGIEELFFDGTSEIDIGGTRVPIARAEDIVTMKILAGRPKDIEDVAAILIAQGDRFDEARARQMLGMLEQALDQRDLLPLLTESLARAARARR